MKNRRTAPADPSCPSGQTYFTDAQRSKGDRALAEFVQEIRKEAERRTERTGGRIGTDAALPQLVTDAARLRDLYLAAGAVYEGDERTTVMPPPAPPPTHHTLDK